MVSKKKKKRSSPKLRLIFRKSKRFFRPKSGGLQKKKKLRLIFRPKLEIQTFFPPKFRWSPKKKEVETDFSAEIVRFGLVGDASPPKSATDDEIVSIFFMNTHVKRLTIAFSVSRDRRVEMHQSMNYLTKVLIKSRGLKG